MDLERYNKRKNIREYSFLKFAKNTHASIIQKILNLFILEKKSAKEIETRLKRIYFSVSNYVTITKNLHNFRYFIAEYIKYNYKIK